MQGFRYKSYFTTGLTLRRAGFLIVLAIVVSTIGYMYIEGANFIAAFYMTVITLSTVGYEEVVPLSDAGRMFSSLMILANMAILALTISSFTEYIIEGQFFKQLNQRRMEKRIRQLENHIIICGYSRYAEESIVHFNKAGQPILLIERMEDRIQWFHDRHPSGLYIQADASEDEVLELAQIKKAKALVSAMSDNSENIFITLTARQLNPDIKIVARTADNRTEAKLRKAGADHIIMPERMGGFYMATFVNKPGTIEFFDAITQEWESELHIEEVPYEDIKPEFRNKSIGSINIQDNTGANVIGFRDQDSKYIINPEATVILHPGTSLIALGTEKQIKALTEYCGT